MPVAGVEPAPRCRDRILSPARLPVPPHRRRYLGIIAQHFKKINSFLNFLSKIPTYVRMLDFLRDFVYNVSVNRKNQNWI